MTVYAALLRLYPRAFREAYAEDMALLLARQLRDEHPLRVWARTVLDIALTTPALHLETRMSRPVSPTALYGTAGAVTLLAAAALATVGPSAPVLVVAGLLLALAGVSWRRARALAAPRPGRGRAYLVAGAVGLTATLLSVRGADDLATGPWVVFVVALLASAGLLVAGLVLTLTRTAPRPSS